MQHYRLHFSIFPPACGLSSSSSDYPPVALLTCKCMTGSLFGSIRVNTIRKLTTRAVEKKGMNHGSELNSARAELLRAFHTAVGLNRHGKRWKPRNHGSYIIIEADAIHQTSESDFINVTLMYLMGRGFGKDSSSF
jgi:hypothetical protein